MFGRLRFAAFLISVYCFDGGGMRFSGTVFFFVFLICWGPGGAWGAQVAVLPGSTTNTEQTQQPVNERRALTCSNARVRVAAAPVCMPAQGERECTFADDYLFIST